MVELKKSASYVSQEQAAQVLQQALKEDKSNLVESREQAEQYAVQVAASRSETFTLVFKGSTTASRISDDDEIA